MPLPDWFDKTDTAVKVALIAAFAALTTNVISIAHSFFGTPLKYWLEKRALRNKLETEYEYEQRRNLRELIGRYQGRMLEAGEALNHRLWNLYENHDKGWLNAAGDYSNVGYYHLSFVRRFLGFFALARQFESEAVLIDSRIAAKADLDFVKFTKAFAWTACDVDLFNKVRYDPEHQVDHFFRDTLRDICDSCIASGKVLGRDEIYSVLFENRHFHIAFSFFDGLKKNEDRLRWDRLVALHLVLLGFINSFGYDMQQSSSQQFIDVAQKANNGQVLRNLSDWLIRFGLQKNSSVKLIKSAIQTTLS